MWCLGNGNWKSEAGKEREMWNVETENHKPENRNVECRNWKCGFWKPEIRNW
jgi:hypothetical protein